MNVQQQRKRLKHPLSEVGGVGSSQQYCPYSIKPYLLAIFVQFKTR